MSEQHDTAPADLVEYGLVQFYLSLANTMNLPWGKEPDFVWVHNPVTGWPSFILDIRFAAGNEEKRTDDLVHAAGFHQLPDSLIVSDHRSPELLNFLTQAGYVPVLSWTGMWHNPLSPGTLPVNGQVRLEKVTSLLLATDFARIVNDFLFGRNNISPQQVLASVQGDVWFYLVYLGALPAGSIALHLTDSLCGIYLVTVIPEFRRMGIGLTATLLAENIAWQAGCNKFILHASKMGEPVYAKLGFQPVSKLWILKLRDKNGCATKK